PARADDWQRGGALALPAEYAEWAAQQGWVAGTGERREAVLTSRVKLNAAGDESDGRDIERRLRIVSPREGDVYRLPPGIDGRYATIALRAAGGPARWIVDGIPIEGGRWQLAAGTHVAVAEAAGRRDSVRFTVD
ncbi:MAG: hypothetical protein M3Y31_08175, partial [Gemmatimonadota bacterium]|nr:hypothetical protein [Gemmatimonadota bacterium]